MGDIDDLVSGLAENFVVSDEHLSTSAPHPRFSEYYKKAGRSKEESQAKRRLELLDRQKKNRLDRQLKARELALGDLGDEDLEALEETGMDITQSSARTYGYRKPSKNNTYKDQLMLSEWMVDVPEDIASNWIAVASPEGRRCLVVASKGSTVAYSKTGWQMKSFKSFLPGGGHSKKGYTLLDCIFSEVDSTFFVLDVLYWGQPTLDSDTEFRFFWCKSKLDESLEFQEISKHNPYRFVPAPVCSANRDELCGFMKQNFPFQSKLDGVLFYHKEAHYWQGRTPLVLWLKPFMLPLVLNVEVPKEYLEGYEQYTAAGFREEFNNKQQAKLESNKNKTVS